MTGKKPPSQRSRRAKRKGKDSVFTFLFSDPEELIKLYRTLHPEDKKTTEKDLVDITYKSVLFDGQYNDLGFRVGDSIIILVEAQSTWSVNIIVRMLCYLAETYKSYFAEQEISLHNSVKVKLPRPELYVVYTGSRRKRPEKITLSEEFFGGEKTAVDVEVKILYGDKPGNIVSEYVEFTRIFDRQTKKYGLTQKAIKETIRLCYEKKILLRFLQKREVEIMTIMDATYEQRIANKNLRKRERAKGKAEGIAEGEAKEKMAIAKNLITMGSLNYASIAQATGLSVEQVAQIAIP